MRGVITSLHKHQPEDFQLSECIVRLEVPSGNRQKAGCRFLLESLMLVLLVPVLMLRNMVLVMLALAMSIKLHSTRCREKINTGVPKAQPGIQNVMQPNMKGKPKLHTALHHDGSQQHWRRPGDRAESSAQPLMQKNQMRTPGGVSKVLIAIGNASLYHLHPYIVTPVVPQLAGPLKVCGVGHIGIYKLLYYIAGMHIQRDEGAQGQTILRRHS